MTTSAANPRSDPPQSDALRANLLVTAVGPITIDPSQEILRTVVERYAGVLNALDRLLRELNHPYRNWRLILPELRGFVLKNGARFVSHPRGPDCFRQFCDLFLRALDEVKGKALTHMALEGLTAFLERQATLINPGQLHAYAPAFDAVFRRLSALPPSQLLLLGQTHHPIRRTVLALEKKSAPRGLLLDPGPVRDLAVRSLRVTYEYWMDQADPAWYAKVGADSCNEISHHALECAVDSLEKLARQPESAEQILQLSRLPAFIDIVRGYRQAAERLGHISANASASTEQLIEGRKLRFLFHIMETDGLAMIHEETLREINRSLIHLVQLKQGFEELQDSFLKTFAFLKANVVNYPHTALQCIEVLGVEVFKRGNSHLMEAFLEQAVRFGFQYSAVTGVGNDWQPICNPAHLYNIRVWLNLITLHPKWSSTLLSALIINLKLTGALIRDTDLFQREITQLLNSNIHGVYNLVKQFTRLLPVYFNEIGAEGELRDVSTELDEITRRQDRLVHFLRKQCHVESTNLIVDLVGNIFHYWKTGDRSVLTTLVSQPVLEETRAMGPHFEGVHRLVNLLCTEAGEQSTPLAWPAQGLRERVMAHDGVPEADRRRVFLLIRLYQLLDLKYNLGFRGILEPLRQAAAAGIPHMTGLMAVLNDGVTGYDRLVALLDALEALKQVILSPESFPAEEAIYQKRHIAVDIPSVYGHYRERKFDALSLTFRLENLAKVELEALTAKIPESFITRAAFFKAAKYLKVFLRALDLDGVASRQLNNLRDVLDRFLELNQFSYHQYLDIFRAFSDGVKDIIHAYYTTYHRDNLATIVPMIPAGLFQPRYVPLLDDDPVTTLDRVSESFLRDLIAETFGLQTFDLFISRIRRILACQQENLNAVQLDRLMTYDPTKLFCPIHRPADRVRNLVYLGNKGYNLTELVDNGALVPAGTILTTEYFRCREVIHGYPPANRDFMAQLRRQVAIIEQATGLGFGVPGNPLLLSVRSGALISMPGMMQTIHNVGINESIVHGLVARSGNAFFAWDNYRRFIQSWSMTFKANRAVFNDRMHAAKRRHGIRKKRQFTSEQMAELAREYHRAALEMTIPIPEDPWEQLLAAISQVVASWESDKAREYRRIMDIADDWGTAVVLQRMVYGNLHDQSGTGVLFTAHPHRKLDRVVLWGDYTPGNQGEDIVGGLVATSPISREQCQHDRRPPESSLEHCYPEIYQKLLEVARHLIYDRGWNPQEMEFTFDGPQADNLFLLQSREMVTSKSQSPVANGFVRTPALKKTRLARGIGVSGGALCGLAVFNLEEIERLRAMNPETPLILIRYDTVPDDIKEISLADGLLTTRGGQTSHAAIVAARLNKTCVVGCENVTVRENIGQCEIDTYTICCGDRISIDGNSGLLFAGWHPIVSVLDNRANRDEDEMAGFEE